MDYDKNDSYKRMMERAGQQIVGAMFIGFAILICVALFVVH
ncbi:multisubunit Na+/H+ antiporter MnhG subunit [Mucilaginibacter sp. UYP25]